MATASRTKTPMEVRQIPFAMALLVPDGAALTSVQPFISRQASTYAPLLTCDVSAQVTAGDTTIQLSANPRAGALLILDMGGATEERVKVISVAGAGAPFTATITPAFWADHGTGTDNVSYELGMNARMLVDETPTPSGTNVTLTVRRGAHGQIYRVSVLGTCNDASSQVVEDEIDLLVTDVSPTETNIKQPTEQRQMAALMSALMAEAHQTGATISSGAAYASDTTSISAALAAGALMEATTILLNTNPGIGALLVLSPTTTAERVYVSNAVIDGGGPNYTCTVQPPIEFGYDSATTVTVYRGYNATFLTSGTSTISGFEARNVARRGAYGKTFKLVWTATLDTGEVLQHSGIAATTEL